MQFIIREDNFDKIGPRFAFWSTQGYIPSYGRKSLDYPTKKGCCHCSALVHAFAVLGMTVAENAKTAYNAYALSCTLQLLQN